MQPEILKIDADNPEPSLIAYAAEQIRQGKVVVMPTDTFYGLAVDPFNLRAVDQVYEIKGRERVKPLSLLIENVDHAEQLGNNLPDDFYILAKHFWPGPLTMIVKAAPRLPLKVTANTGNIAIRVPDAKIAQEVIRAANTALTATTANITGLPECTDAQAVRHQLRERVPLIVDGGTSKRNIHSTIVNFTEGKWFVQREGAIPVHAIEDLLGDQ